MILDNEQQRAFFLELINAAQFPGRALRVAAEIAAAVERATVAAHQVDTSPADYSRAGSSAVSME